VLCGGYNLAQALDIYLSFKFIKEIEHLARFLVQGLAKVLGIETVGPGTYLDQGEKR